MKSDCLPFSQIPHTTRLFADFLAHSSSVHKFYPRSAYFKEWFQDEAKAIRYDDARRQKVAGVLERQNRNWGASPKTLQNIERLRSGALAVVTGQQVGLFGGPAFSLYKALTAVKLAEIATAAGVETVPVFWLATEDHDLAEVNHVAIPGSDGVLKTLSTAAHGVDDAPVGKIVFDSEIEIVAEEAAALLGESEVVAALREFYRAGENFGSAFARLFTRLFSDWGVILLEASDPELHQIGMPIYRAAVEHAAELNQALLARGEELEEAGYHQQVKVTPSSTLLFDTGSGARMPIHRRADSGEFVLGEQEISHDDLLSRVSSSPQQYSANVLLRPAIQDYLLPTLAYAGGSAEVAYFAQVAVVQQKLLGRVTPILPRFSATIVEPKPRSLLDRYRLALADLFQGPELLRRRLAEHVLPEDLQNAFAQAATSLDKNLEAVRDAISRLDSTLGDSANNAASKMRYQLEQLRAKAARAELRRVEVIGRHADLLSNALFPNKALQEREIPGIYFLSRHGAGLLHELYQSIQAECLDHQVLSL